VEKQNQKSSMVFTWIFDEREDEREVGKTQDVNEKYLVLGDKTITLLDTPGHRDLVPVMISGASHCDYGFLMVESEKVRFETGFTFGGQTKEHAKLLNSIGLKGLIVVVNKMDAVNWEESAFQYAVTKITEFFQFEGLDNLGEVKFVPISALTGENIVKPVGKVAPWWKEGPLVELMSRIVLFRKIQLEC
jgi:translation elongation factor EF-1alpha